MSSIDILNISKDEAAAYLENDDVLGVVEGAGEVDLGAVEVGHEVVAPRDAKGLAVTKLREI